MRIQLEISENKRKQIKTLIEKADFKTYSELFNNAVTLLQWSIQQIEAGRSILSVDQESGKERELLMPFLQHVEQSAGKEVELVPAHRLSQKR
jgi:Arc/MetJ-type ribon-helix-helix transcriptional regulator